MPLSKLFALVENSRLSYDKRTPVEVRRGTLRRQATDRTWWRDDTRVFTTRETFQQLAAMGKVNRVLKHLGRWS